MTTELRIPDVGESIQEVQISHWLKREGEYVEEDENIVELETDKASMELPSPVNGVLKILKKEGQAAVIGETIAYVDEGARPVESRSTTSKTSDSEQPAAQEKRIAQDPTKLKQDEPAQRDSQSPAETRRPDKRSNDERQASVISQESDNSQATDDSSQETDDSVERHRDETPPSPALPTPSARRALREHGLQANEVQAAGKQLRREDVLRHVAQHQPSKDDDGSPQNAKVHSKKQTRTAPGTSDPSAAATDETALEEIVPMSMIRRRIAERLVEAQQNAALLTTYNEIDMTAVVALRQEFGERFRERYGVKLGFMSFFVKAVVDALREVPELNAEIRGTNIVYRQRYDIGIAVGSQHGLVVPVIRHAERLSFAEIERAIADFAARANSKKLLPQELSGGTFTISNGGIYGSLLSTPIVNPPQSGVLGMHTIQDRPVARDGQIVIRPMMYVALTYDHRIIDGREAVHWLRRVTETIEQPSRMLIEA